MAGLDSRVCMALGLVSRVCPGGPNTAQWTVQGDHNFGGTIDSVTHIYIYKWSPHLFIVVLQIGL